MVDESEIATVGDLIDYLSTSFDGKLNLCFWYEGGAYCNCENIITGMLGDMMFKNISDIKKTDVECPSDAYANVDDKFVFVF